MKSKDDDIKKVQWRMVWKSMMDNSGNQCNKKECEKIKIKYKECNSGGYYLSTKVLILNKS